MKIVYLWALILFISTGVQAQLSKTVDLTAGHLINALTANELNTVTDLTITGTIDARDFKTMRDEMPVLEDLDMSEAQIIAYEGDEGPSKATSVYPADAIPQDAFHIVSIGKTSLQSVLIPLTTKVIGPWAFNRCTGLTSFDIPPSVTSIQAYAFATCYTITSLTIPESVETIERGAFTVCSALMSITIPSKVDSIQMRTFSGCDALSSVDIPSSVTYIGEQAFMGCGALESITLPSSLKTIGSHAFYLCNALQSLTLPESITSIGEGAFMDCNNLEGTVILPDGLSIIENETFAGCSKLITVELPSSVDSIGEAAFLRCTNLQTIDLPSSIVYMGNSAFAECSSLTDAFPLPSSLKMIGARAFADCTSLAGELILPDGLTTLKTQAFTYCRSLTSLVIPSSVTSIGYGAFEFCSGLTSIEVQHAIPLSLNAAQNVFTGVDKTTTTLHVPVGTKELYASAYEWRDFEQIVEDIEGFRLNASSVNFTPTGATDNSIEVTANFAWTATTDQSWLTVSPTSGDDSQPLAITAEANTALSSREGTVTLSAEGIPSQVIRVAQQSTPRVLSITPGSLGKAMSQEEKQAISSLTLTGSMDARDFNTIRFQMPLLEVLDITEVDIEAYTDTTFGNNIDHPEDAIPFAIHEWNDSPQTSYSLSEHPKLSVVKLPKSLKTIGYRAFFASPIKTLEMQSSVTHIGIEAFYACSFLTDINLPSSLTSISEAAFRACSSLPSIELPSSLKQIESGTFEGCSALKSIVIPPSITSMGEYAFKGCTSLESVTISSSLTTISLEAFRDCSSLTKLVIPQGVKQMAGFAFMGCSDLHTLTLPATLTAIGRAAFADCTSLDTIYSFAVSPPDLNNPEGWDVFDKVDKSKCLLYVPIGTKEEYASAFEWEDFENIVEMDPFSLENTALTLEAIENSQATVKLTSSIPWTATSDQEWLTVNPASGSEGLLLTLTAKANSTNSDRTATVTVIATGIDTLTLSVTQHSLATGIEDIDANRPFAQVYPNPFSREMSIEIANPSLEEVSVEIFGISGQKIRTLAKAQKGLRISLRWNGTNEQGQQVPEGIYLLKVNEETMKVVKK